jgi:hypothetical protein
MDEHASEEDATLQSSKLKAQSAKPKAQSSKLKAQSPKPKAQSAKSEARFAFLRFALLGFAL